MALLFWGRMGMVRVARNKAEVFFSIMFTSDFKGFTRSGMEKMELQRLLGLV
jgi:hypothetical protein